MKFSTGCFFTAILLCLFNTTYAQTGYTIAGKVITENQQSAEGATITLLRYTDSAIVKSAVCNKTGEYELSSIKAGNYILVAHKIGYKRFYSDKFQVGNANITIPAITLTIITNQLNQVTITGKKDYIEVHPDKTVLNVERSILAAGNSVFDILTTAPGVRVKEDQVYIKGGQKALIAINGKPIGQLNDEQLAELLKSYQSSMISQIEIIPNPSAKYDASGGGLINIILKKNKDYGFKANITESAAAGQDYKLNTGINLNYRTEKFNFFGNYAFTDSKIPRMLDIDRTIGQSDYDVNYNSISHLKNSSYSGGVDYSLTTKQTIGALVYGYHNDLGIDKNNITNIETNNVLDSDITTQSHIDRAITNLNYNVNYRGTFGKNDNTSLSADFDYSTYHRHSDELLQNDFFNGEGVPYRDDLFYTDKSPSRIKVRSEKIDFTQVLSKISSLSAGIKNSQVNSNNMIDFEQSTSADDDFTPVPSLTDHFIYAERINAAYTTYTGKFNKTDLVIGLRAEQTDSYGESLNPNKTVTRSYFDLFPNFQLSQPLGADNNFSVDYNRRVTRPNYQDLNPFVAYIDQYSYSTGNTFLKPEYTNTIQLADIYKDKYKVTLSAVIINDFFVPIFQQNDSTKVFTTTTDNVGTRYEYILDFTIPFNITKWWTIDAYLYGSYEKFAYFDHTNKTTTDFEVEATQNFTITPTIRAEVYTSWESTTFYGIKQYGSEFDSRAGISKSILNSNGTIKLAVSDIFNSSAYRYNTHYENLDLTGREKAGSRFVTATFTYRFGKQSVKNISKHTGGNADEQRRLSGSGNEN